MDRKSFESLVETGAFADFADFAEQNSGWEKPVPFDEAQTLDFPTECLPGPLGAFVECLSDSTQTPEEMAGILSLGVLSTAVQSKYTVEITPDWSEPLCLYCVAVAPPGERKSAVISALTRPLYVYEAARRDSEAIEIAQNQTERALLERALEAAKTCAAKGKGDFSAKRDEALNLSAQLAEFKDRHPFRLLVDDTTPEKLVDLMDAQGGSMTVCSAEGGIFDSLRGRYDKTANFDVYLKGHAGDVIVVDRIGRRPNSIPNPRLSMMLAIQPEVLSGLMTDSTLRGRGLCGRFLYAICKSKMGHREVSPPPIPDPVRSNFNSFVRRILSDEGDGVIKLSPAADAARKSYQEFIERRLGSEWESLRDWGGKLVGTMMRIAALLHAAETENPADHPISSETIAAATRIAEFLASHAVAAYQAMGADRGYEDARYLWRKIEATAAEEINKRDLFNICRGKFKRVQDMNNAIDVLTDMNYIREVEASTGGRPTKKLFVNPLCRRAIYAKSAKGAV